MSDKNKPSSPMPTPPPAKPPMPVPAPINFNEVREDGNRIPLSERGGEKVTTLVDRPPPRR